MQPPPQPCVAFVSDFGLDDPFVGVCHAVIAGIAPDVRVVDLTHGIRPQDVRHGARVLADCVAYTGPWVHLAVVDPGVGTARRGVVLVAGHTGALLVGPDNGLLLAAAARLGGVSGAWELTSQAHRRPTVSPTFHGRDVFAPAAAHLAAGVAPSELGPPVDPDALVGLPAGRTQVRAGRVETEVLAVDRFGNLQLEAAPADLDVAGLHGGELDVEVGGARHRACRGHTFGDVAPGGLLVFTDSSGALAVAVRSGSAARLLGAEAGAQVMVAAAAG